MIENWIVCPESIIPEVYGAANNCCQIEGCFSSALWQLC